MSPRCAATIATLTDVGDKVHNGAIAFEETEAHNKAAIDTVPDA